MSGKDTGQIDQGMIIDVAEKLLFEGTETNFDLSRAPQPRARHLE